MSIQVNAEKPISNIRYKRLKQAGYEKQQQKKNKTNKTQVSVLKKRLQAELVYIKEYNFKFIF